jgi:hypothetical protein
MAYYMVLASDGFVQTFRGVYDSIAKAEASVSDLESDDLECDIVFFNNLNQDYELDFNV